MLTDFNRLKVFYAIYRRKSAALAAKELYISQSAVSQSLGKLERELNLQLFVRMHKKLVPTPAAERLYGIIDPFVRGLEGGIAWLEAEKSGPRGLLRIGAPVEFGSRSLVDAVCAFRRGCPEVFFDVALGHPDTLLPRLAAGELDLVFADMFSGGGRGMKLPQFTVSPVVTEKLVLVCSACYFAARLAAGRGPAVISGCDFVDYSHGHPALDNWFRHHYNKTFPGLKVVLAVESVQAVLSAVKGGLGLGIIPEYLVRGELRDGSLKAVRTGKPELINCISLVRLKGRAASPAEKAFLESFRRAL